MAALDRTRLIGRLFPSSLDILARFFYQYNGRYARSLATWLPSINNKADNRDDGGVHAIDVDRADTRNGAADSPNNRNAGGGMPARRSYCPHRNGNDGHNR